MGTTHIVSDLPKHEFVYDKNTVMKDTHQMRSKKTPATFEYTSLEAALNFKWKKPVLKPKRMKRIAPTLGLGVFVLNRFQTGHNRW